eukprot:TRINITY_DN15281_c0_g1_i1.p1 TRINITY_DN15281_c0_g1~~TRINITY_DN15281_c0_g1_i1.p1  ORF type:complete len:206 (-),score=13.92 TRINITY_DN15281_c0_g1_i1:1-618(-)
METLATELVMRVLFFVGPSEVCRTVQLLSHHWYHLANDSHLWQQFCVSEGLPSSCTTSWKAHYIDEQPLGLSKDQVVYVELTLIGPESGGKSALVNCLRSKPFQPTLAPTVGAAFVSHCIQFGSGLAKLEIWDTAGQARYITMAPMYVRSSRSFMLVFDANSEVSWEKVAHWHSLVTSWVSPFLSFFSLSSFFYLSSCSDLLQLL